MIHKEAHERRGEVVTLKGGTKYRIEDWADRVLGQSWMAANGNPAALYYAVRRAALDLPLNNEVLYGKTFPDGLGLIVHVSEITE